ncbi:MAG: MYXO-CTERM sorting domain-containing protein [Deltaproteobacteria bacterium]|nr:MYXO-CTERM sorting domain-containing protein [Deltaproteobacteria bacterium]
MRRSAVLLALASLLCAAPALANETEPQDIRLYYADTILEGVSYDTGWLPDTSSDIKIRFVVLVDGDVQVDMWGTHYVQWPEAFTFHLDGTPDMGHVSVDYGLEFSMMLEYDFGILGSGSYVVPLHDYIPPIIDVLADAEFTPFMLEGHPDWVLDFEGETATTELVNAPIALAPGVSLDLALGFHPTLICDYRADSIDVGPSVMEREGETVLVPWTTSGFLSIPIVYHGNLFCSFNATLVPSVSICVGVCFDLASFDIDLPLDEDSRVLDFDPVEVTYEYPVLDVDTLSVDFGTVEVGEEKYMDLVVRNTGRGYLEVTLALEPWDGAFYYFPFSGIAVPPGEEREVRLYFTPPGPGPHIATLTLDSNAPVDGSADISLTGIGAAPEIPDDASTDPDCECDDCSRHATGCGCRVAGAGTPAPAALVLLLVAAALLLRIRKKDA